MKKGILSFVFFIFCLPVIAQQQVKEIPFMPYVQAGNSGACVTTCPSEDSRILPFKNGSQQQRMTTILFAQNSIKIPQESASIIAEVAKRALATGNILKIVAYRTPQMDMSIAQNRARVVKDALAGFGVTNVRVNLAVQKKPVVTVHRVDIFEQ